MSEDHAARNIVKTGTNVKITEVKKAESMKVVKFQAKIISCFVILLTTSKVLLNCNDLLEREKMQII